MNLRYSLREQGKYSEAESIYRQTLRLRMEVLGIDHPITLASISHLTNSLHQQDKYAEAEAIQRQADGKSEQIMLLTGHPNSILDAAANKKRKAEPKGNRALHRST